MREEIPEESWVVTVALAPLRATLWLLFWGAMYLLEDDEDEKTLLDRCPFNGCRHSVGNDDCNIGKKKVDIPESNKKHTWVCFVIGALSTAIVVGHIPDSFFEHCKDPIPHSVKIDGHKMFVYFTCSSSVPKSSGEGQPAGLRSPPDEQGESSQD